MPVKYIIMPVTLTICACMGFALHYAILPDAFSHDATAALQMQGVFFNWPSPFSVPKRKTAFNQPELLFHEILHLRKL